MRNNNVSVEENVRISPNIRGNGLKRMRKDHRPDRPSAARNRTRTF
jgi:hypothetical protein